MVFSNLVFLFLFLPIVLLVYYVGPKAFRNYWLLLVSLFFYAWGEPLYITIMLGSVLINYFFGILTEKYLDHEVYSRRIIALTVIVNIGLLGVFKYASFFVDSTNDLFGLNFQVPIIDLPIGISFFTFHSISYVVDVYRRKSKAQRNLFDLALYISLFPQLVAGPIVRYNFIAHELHDREHSYEKFASGTQRFLAGLIKKIIIANPLGQVADELFAVSAGDMSSATAWIAILAYTLQIYFDFSGYSDMAIGLAKMFGFTFPENFNYPYIASSITDFWRRWHISLSTWFRDYVYIPLGGNRVAPWKVYRNLFIVWTLTGFWHGASWTFMAWGFYYGFIIAIERAFLSKYIEKSPFILRHIYVLLLVMIGWVFFRADSFSYSTEFIGVLFGFGGQGWWDDTTTLYVMNNWTVFLCGLLFATPILPTTMGFLQRKYHGFVNSIPFAFATTAVYMLLFL
ncbi:MAG: MBOAT family O-acyltransferase, partial [Bacilli bacterium]